MLPHAKLIETCIAACLHVSMLISGPRVTDLGWSPADNLSFLHRCYNEVTNRILNNFGGNKQISSRASNEGSQRFHNHGEGPY